jgi:hypothetical protein
MKIITKEIATKENQCVTFFAASLLPFNRFLRETEFAAVITECGAKIVSEPATAETEDVDGLPRDMAADPDALDSAMLPPLPLLASESLLESTSLQCAD